MVNIQRRKDSEAARRRILSACVKLFIENGYKNTRMADILNIAEVSNSTFQNLFRTKDGVLIELVEFMFDSQFSMARHITDGSESPALVYAMETSIQLAITELNENLREIYVYAYSLPETTEYIYRRTSDELYEIFGSYMPECDESDFYEMEIGTAGIMRGYMAKECNKYFTLEKKVKRFLAISLDVYNVPPEERKEIIAEVIGMNIENIANEVIQKLFKALEMRFEFKLNKKEEITV